VNFFPHSLGQNVAVNHFKVTSRVQVYKTAYLTDFNYEKKTLWKQASRRDTPGIGFGPRLSSGGHVRAGRLECVNLFQLMCQYAYANMAVKIGTDYTIMKYRFHII